MDRQKKIKIGFYVAGVVTLILAGTAIGLYFYFTADTNSTAKLFQDITITSSKPQDTLRPGDKVMINYTGTYTGPASYRFSSDKGKNFINITDSTEKHIEYTLPDSTFSPYCMIRVTNASDATEYVNSAFFAVTPSFSIHGAGEKDGSQIPIETNLFLEVDTNAWDGIFSKVGNIELDVETRVLTQKEWVNQKDSVTTDVKDKRVIWNVPSDLINQTFLIRVSTYQLGLAGFPSELSYTLPFPVTAVAQTGNASKVSGTILSFIVMDRTGTLLTTGYPLQSIQVGWVTSVLVPLLKIEWGLSADGSGTWTSLATHLYGPEGTVRLIVPSDIPLNKDVYFRITDEQDSFNYAISSPMTFSTDWSIVDQPKDKTQNVIMYPLGYNLTVTVKIDGFTSEYAEPSNWTTVLKTTSSPDVKLDVTPTILLQDPSKNTYGFFYTFEKPLLPKEDFFPFTLTLSFKGGEAKKTPFTFYAELPPDDGLATGKPFTGIHLFHPEIECSATLQAAECEAKRLEDIPKDMTSGTSYTFIYTGSHIGFDCTPDPTCDGQAPVLWKVLYDEVDAKGGKVQHDLLAGATVNLNTTMYTKRYLTINFPVDMKAYGAFIRLSLPRAQSADGVAITFDSETFNVLPKKAEILTSSSSSTGTRVYDALQTIFKPLIDGKSTQGNRRLWGTRTQHTFHSGPAGGTTFDRDETEHFTADRENAQFYFRKARPEPRTDDDTEEETRQLQLTLEAEEMKTEEAEEHAEAEEEAKHIVFGDTVQSLKSKPPQLHVTGSDGHSGKFQSPAVAKVHLLQDPQQSRSTLGFVGQDGQTRITHYGKLFPLYVKHPLDKNPVSKTATRDIDIVSQDSSGNVKQVPFSLI